MQNLKFGAGVLVIFPMSPIIYITATRGRRCLKPQRISQEMVLRRFAQSSADILSFPCSPSKVTISPSCKSGVWNSHLT